MGVLNLPATGTVYVDANCVIYSVEKIQPFAALLTPLWYAAASGKLQVITSELTLLESLVGPIRAGNDELERLLLEFLSNSAEMRLVAIDASLLVHAARLRAKSGFKTPDAIHAATAAASGCNLFVTNDPHFRRMDALEVAILSEIV